MKVVDEDVILQLRIPPPPMPLAWARTVMPYVPRHLYGKSAQHVPTVRGEEPAAEDTGAAPPSEQHVVPDIAAVQVCRVLFTHSATHRPRHPHDTQPASLQRDYLAVLVNRGWEAGADPNARDSDAHIVSKLAALQLHRACPAGFVFIWVDKEHIAPVMDLMYKWRFVYVENLNWLLLGPDNQLLGLPADYFARSHLTLFIFRKDGTSGAPSIGRCWVVGHRAHRLRCWQGHRAASPAQPRRVFRLCAGGRRSSPRNLCGH